MFATWEGWVPSRDQSPPPPPRLISGRRFFRVHLSLSSSAARRFSNNSTHLLCLLNSKSAVHCTVHQSNWTRSFPFTIFSGIQLAQRVRGESAEPSGGQRASRCLQVLLEYIHCAVNRVRFSAAAAAVRAACGRGQRSEPIRLARLFNGSRALERRSTERGSSPLCVRPQRIARALSHCTHSDTQEYNTYTPHRSAHRLMTHSTH